MGDPVPPQVKASHTTTVRPGQIWADNDKRGYGRRIRVVAIEAAMPATDHTRAVPARAVVELVDQRGRPARGAEHQQRAEPGRQTRIRLDRFKPTSTGYRLVSDASETAGGAA